MALPPRLRRRTARRPARSAGLVDVELVRIDRALHDRFAEAVGGGDEHHVAESGIGVEREHHAARAEVAAHHVLHAHREGHLAVIEALVHAIGDGAIVEQRGVDLVHRREQAVAAAHVEEGLLLAGERGLGQILGGGRGAHRHGDLAAGIHLLPGIQHLALQPLRERRGEHPAADLRADVRQLARRRRRPGRPAPG